MIYTSLTILFSGLFTYVFDLMLQALAILTSQKNVVDVPIPDDGEVTVYGDIHGQYYDMLNAFELNGLPSDTNPTIFNGDLVDRGSFSMEVALVLLSLKVLYPEHVHIARGNHETKSMNKVYGFEGEAKAKYPFLQCFSILFIAWFPPLCLFAVPFLIIYLDVDCFYM